jgi:hypothetical protein
MGRCGCEAGCQCVLSAGDNVVVSGIGSVDTPYVVGLLLVSPNGTHYRLTVDDVGVITAVAI